MLGIRGWSRSAQVVRHSALSQEACVREFGFAPRQGSVKAWGGVQRITTEAGTDKSGHIDGGPNEGIFFLDSKQHPASWLLIRD